MPALALGASTTVVVSIADMGSTLFLALPVLLSANTSLLGGLQVGGIVGQTRTTVSVLVKAPLLAVAAGCTLQIVAWRLG